MQELKDQCKDFQEKLDLPFIKDDPEACLVRMMELETIMSASGKLLADAKYIQNEQQSDLKAIVDELMSQKLILTPTIMNNYVKARTKEINYIVDWSERINRSATHMLDSIRSAISYRKTELTNLNYK